MQKDILLISEKANRVRKNLALFAFLVAKKNFSVSLKVSCIVFCFFVFLSLPVSAQEITTPDTVGIEEYTIINSNSIDTFSMQEKSLIRKHSPSKALWMSAVLPGLGQAYNKQYWKIPIIYALGGVTTYFAIINYQDAQKFKKEYIRRDNKDTANYNPNYLNYPDQSIYNLYNAYNKNFQLMIVLTSVVYALNLLDAYVSAHLFTFDITDDISMQISPEINYSSFVFSNQPEFGFKFKFTF